MRRFVVIPLIPVFVFLLFFGAFFWAKGQDPFSRKWFALRVAPHESLNCVQVLPKPIWKCPVIIFVHGAGGNLMEDGSDLRQMAEMGVATISLEYDQTNEGAFAPQFEVLLQYIARQKWADTNAIAWVGFSLGANRLFDFALQNRTQQPQLLVQLSGDGLLNGQTNSALQSLHCPVLLIHGGADEIFPVGDKERPASLLSSSGLLVVLTIFPNRLHDLRPDREVIFRCIGEYCLAHLSGAGIWKNYHSIAEWDAETSPFWLFCTPAAAWALGCFIWAHYRKPRSLEKIKLKRNELALRYIASILAILTLLDTTLHLVPLHFSVSGKTLAIAQKYLVPTTEQADFQFLAAQPIWHGVKLQTLLTHTELANYNRELINWKSDDANYQYYVLSPMITGNPGEQFNWRRPLWEEFYPRIRHESSSKDAATIVVRHLRERVTIADFPNLPHDVPEIWLRQITDKRGFEIIYVAALRSVGVPARLDKNRRAEFFSDQEWRAAPRPFVESVIGD